MRLNQVSISISRFGKAVPKDYPEKMQHISVYSDSSASVFEALSMAYCQAINAIREYQNVAVRTDVCVNAEDRLYGGMLNRRNDDAAVYYYDQRLPMLKDLLYCLEHAEEIIGIIRNSSDRAAASAALQEQLGLSEARARAALRIRFDLFTMDEVEEVRAEVRKAEEALGRREESRKDAMTESKTEETP